MAEKRRRKGRSDVALNKEGGGRLTFFCACAPSRVRCSLEVGGEIGTIEIRREGKGKSGFLRWEVDVPNCCVLLNVVEKIRTGFDA